jgi:sigma-B regulation protein RsbU (phosphoserine phosphatase)
MVIADVSGKGVPAALFMMTCKAIIKGTALRGGTPAEILSYVNDRLQEDNESDMFVTVWLGMLDISTGVVTACSAGHEYPFVTDEYGNYQKLEDPHGVVCGVLQNLSYEDYSFTIPGNGRLFVYTDGVAEALNKDDEMFGTDRLRNCLNANNSADPAEVVAAMRKELTTFADGAEQFDDVTMLSLWYKGQHN